MWEDKFAVVPNKGGTSTNSSSLQALDCIESAGSDEDEVCLSGQQAHSSPHLQTKSPEHSRTLRPVKTSHGFRPITSVQGRRRPMFASRRNSKPLLRSSSHTEVTKPIVTAILGDELRNSENVATRRSSMPACVDLMLGQGRVDPFNAYPVRDVPVYVHEYLDHALKITWPGVCPATPSTGQNPVSRAWLQCALGSPMAFHALVFAAALHHTYLRGKADLLDGHSMDLLQLSHQTRAIQYINALLSGNKGAPPSDALLISILILAAHGPAEGLTTDCELDSEPSHPPSPLARAQNLDFYGSLGFVPAHMHALHILVEQKGGLDKIGLYGLADTLAFGELFGDSLRQTRPRFSSRWEWPISIPIEDSEAVYLTFNFSPTGPPAHVAELITAVGHARAITRALTLYVSDPAAAAPFLDIVRARNALQHRLLSLSAFGGGLMSRQDSVYDACRLALLIYSDMVIYPIPKVQGVRPKLASKLRETLDCCTLHRCWDINPRVMLWIATLGAIAATNTSSRAWYVGKLKVCIELLGLDHYDRYLRLVNTFLWWDYVGAKPLQTLWDETRLHQPAVRPQRFRSVR